MMIGMTYGLDVWSVLWMGVILGFCYLGLVINFVNYIDS